MKKLPPVLVELIELPPIKASNERFLIFSLVPVDGGDGFDVVLCDSRPTLESAKKLAIHYSEFTAKRGVRFSVVDFLGTARGGKWKDNKGDSNGYTG